MLLSFFCGCMFDQEAQNTSLVQQIDIYSVFVYISDPYFLFFFILFFRGEVFLPAAPPLELPLRHFLFHNFSVERFFSPELPVFLPPPRSCLSAISNLYVLPCPPIGPAASHTHTYLYKYSTVLQIKIPKISQKYLKISRCLTHTYLNR